ncbi:uncharacterized protein pdzph1 isoform X2 [Osmerus eperlanus]|uniref:uncharacterized protein pdzph1 isoform X2 n=1 Tax=Osmerus eperlanus TaxID=29151 RepID=UPI002E106079
MSRRRWRSIRGRKSSSSSKQSVSPFIFQKTSKSNSVCCKDELTEKGETDSLRKENVLSASDEEDEKYNGIPSKEKKSKQDNESNCFQNKRISKPKDKETGMNIVTSVTFENSKQSFPNIIFEQSRESFLEEITDCTVAITTTKVKCNVSNVKFQIQEVLQPNNLGRKTTFVVQCQQGEGTNARFHNEFETRLTLKEESFEQSQNGVLTNENKRQHNTLNYKLTLSKTGEEAQETKNTIPSWSFSPSACRKSCCDNDTDFTVPNGSCSPSWPQWTKSSICSSFSSDVLYDIPPPLEFADSKYNTLDGLTEDIASFHIDASCSPCKHQEGFSPTSSNKYIEDSCYPQCLDGTESANLLHVFDQLSESDNYEPMFMRPSSVSRASYTKDFIHSHEGKNWMRNNSIATVEPNPCSSASYLGKTTKRRRTFPGVSDGHRSIQEDLPSYKESFSSDTISHFVMQSLPHHTERLGRFNQVDDRLSPFSINSENTLQSSCTPGSRNTKTQLVRQELVDPFYKTKYVQNPEEVVPGDGKFPEHRLGHGHGQVDEMYFTGNWYEVTDQVNTNAGEQVEQNEVAESGYEEEMLEAEEHTPEPVVEEFSQGDLLIQVIPPSRTTSEEYILEDIPKRNLPPEGDVKVITKQGAHDMLPKCRRGSVMTIILRESDHRCLSTDSKSAEGSSNEMHHKDNLNSEAPLVSPILDMVEGESPSTCEVIDELHPTTSIASSPEISISSLALIHTEDNQTPRSATSSTDQETESQKKTQLYQKDSVEKHSKSSFEGKEHLKPPSDSMHKDPDSGPDHWAKRRKLFKESRQWSSAGGSSITSDITEESDLSCVQTWEHN